MDLTRFTYLARCPSFEHSVQKLRDSAGATFYCKQYAHVTAFLRETTALRRLRATIVPFSCPVIVDADEASLTVLLTEVPGRSLSAEIVTERAIRKIAATFRELHTRVSCDGFDRVSYDEELELFRANIA